MKDDHSPVLKVSLRLMKIQKTNLTVWNHNRNEVLSVAGNPNPVFYEMWFLTIDPVIRVSVSMAKLSKR